MRWCTRLSAVLLCLVISSGAAAGGLDIRDWLSRPGVKLVVVEFYATWCKPCMKAVPRWKALHERYRDQGLRLIVVSTQDPDGACVNPGWNPDEIVCDVDGHLARAFKVGKKLPAAFLWSWRGNLLVRGGHVDEVKRVIEDELGRLPRVTLDEGMDPAIRDLLRVELVRTGKVDVVAGKAEKAALAAIRKRSHDLSFGKASACRLGEELAPNSLLKARLLKTDSGPRLLIQLFNASTGCLSASAGVHYNQSHPEVSVAEAAAELVASLRVPPEMPGAAVASIPTVTATDIDENPGAWNPKGKDVTIIGFQSVPPGAVVMLDGKLLCQDTRKGCNRMLAPGRYSVSMQMEGYQVRTETLELKEGDQIQWELKPTFGLLDITSRPPGRTVLINGKPAGKTPLLDHRLAPGPYEVVIDDPCFYRKGKRLNVKMGERQRLDLQLVPREGAILVTAEDDDGNALEADVLVDQRKVGSTPGTFKVSVCARAVQVRDRHGRSWAAEIKVPERETITLKAKLRGTARKPFRGRKTKKKEKRYGWGFHVGMSGSYLIQDIETDKQRTSPRLGYATGLLVWLRTTKVIYLQLGIDYVNKGGEDDLFTYIQIPLQVKWLWTLGTNLHLAPWMGSYYASLAGNQEISWGEDSAVNKMDYGLAGGVTASWGPTAPGIFYLDLRTEVGLMNALDDNETTLNNRSFLLLLGYYF